MAPLRDVDSLRDYLTLWLALGILAVAVAFTLVLSILICACCGGGNDTKKEGETAKKQLEEKHVEKQAEILDVAKSGIYKSQLNKSATAKSRGASGAPKGSYITPPVASMQGSFAKKSTKSVRASKSTRSGGGQSGKSPAKSPSKSPNQDIQEFAPEGDPAYQSLAELDGSGK